MPMNRKTTQSVGTRVPTQSVGTRMTGACVALVVLATIAAASASAQEAKPAEKVNYTDHILPIFRAKCGTCHSAGQAKGGLVLENFGASMTGGASGPVIEAGDLEGSRLWVTARHAQRAAGDASPRNPSSPTK